jgi:hypothetical protein
MQDTYQITVDGEITYIKFHQPLTPEIARVVIDDVAENHPYEKRLWDFSSVDFVLTQDELIEISQYSREKFIKPSKLAIFAKSDFIFAEARQYGAYRGDENSNFCAFRDFDKAIEWLKK